MGAAVLPGCAPGGRRPHLLLLVTDDHRWDALGCAGNSAIHTPNIDRLAACGLRFSNAFVTTSICMASRAGIFTGQYMRRHRIGDFRQSLTDRALARSYPMLLRESGYYVGFIGKWGVGGEDMHAMEQVGKHFDYWAGTSHHGNYWHEARCRYVTHKGVTDKTNNVCTCPPNGPRPRTGKEGLRDPLHLTTQITPAKFAQFLASRDTSRPFCLSVSFKAAHPPWSDFDPRLSDLYADTAMPIPATATPEDAARQPGFLRSSHSGRVGRKLPSRHEAIERRLRQYYRLITGADMAIGDMQRALEKHGVAEDTVVLLTSDNGYLFGEHGLAGKWLMHEESIRVPMLVADPRLPSRLHGGTSDEMVLNIDIAPTLLDLAGVSAPGSMQGRSFAALLAQPAESMREDWFYEHHFRTKKHPIERTEGVRGRRWKYIRYLDERPFYEQLFDLEADPNETRNLAGDPSHRAILEEQRARWRHYTQTLM